jgi:addiction module RelB/DinJ family antitoxin
MISMGTSTITIKTDEKTKSQALKIADELGLELEGIINAYLKHFVRTETVYFSLDYDESAEELVSAISKKPKGRNKKEK